MARRAGPKGRGSDVKADLIQAACALYEEKGLEPVSLREIAERAGVNQAMIRHYFKDKHGFERALLEIGYHELLTAMPTGEGFQETFEAAVSALNKMPWFTLLRLRLVLVGDAHRDYIWDTYFPQLMQRLNRSLPAKARYNLLCAMCMMDMPQVARKTVGPAFKIDFDDAFAKDYAAHVTRIIAASGTSE